MSVNVDAGGITIPSLDVNTEASLEVEADREERSGGGLSMNLVDQVLAGTDVSSAADDILKRYNLSSNSEGNFSAGIDASDVTSSLQNGFGSAFGASVTSNAQSESSSSVTVGENIDLSLDGTQSSFRG